MPDSGTLYSPLIKLKNALPTFTSITLPEIISLPLNGGTVKLPVNPLTLKITFPFQLAFPSASLVNTFPVPAPVTILNAAGFTLSATTSPTTTSFSSGDDVPIPTFAFDPSTTELARLTTAFAPIAVAFERNGIDKDA